MFFFVSSNILQEADLVLGGILASSIYVGTVDYSATWTDIITSFLIPYPTSSENIEAIVKPFQIEVKSNKKVGPGPTVLNLL